MQFILDDFILKTKKVFKYHGLQSRDIKNYSEELRKVVSHTTANNKVDNVSFREDFDFEFNSLARTRVCTV